jgi:Predicted nucleoside-diphosphate-sugar epimerases
MSAPARPAVLLAGASGLVGGALLRRLLADADGPRVAAVVRRPLELAAPRLQVVVAEFDRLDRTGLPPAGTAFCALGTTMAKAGTEERFRAVDLDAVVAFARAARRAGATRLLAVSALGADSRSRVFYNRVRERRRRRCARSGSTGSRSSVRRSSSGRGGDAPGGAGRRRRHRIRPVGPRRPAFQVAPRSGRRGGRGPPGNRRGELRGVRVVENDEIHRLASGSAPFVR